MSVRHLIAVLGILLGFSEEAARPSFRAQAPAERTPHEDVSLIAQQPKSVVSLGPGLVLVVSGRVAFGNLLLTAATPGKAVTRRLTIRFGEALKDGRIDPRPPGSVRYAEVKVDTQNGVAQAIYPAADKRNTTFPAVLTPAKWGTLIPFRWVEMEGPDAESEASRIVRQAAFDQSWRDDAASFHSSDSELDQVWDLSHYSIKATTFAGVFVDGDRERISYEADAYLNQLGYYAGDPDPAMARRTFDRLVEHPTWPTEWAPYLVFMALADWMETGDRVWLAAHYEVLKTKLLEERVKADGLVRSTPQDIQRGDLIDWPTGERDGYVFTPLNTVVNAFRLRALLDMVVLAEALGKHGEADGYWKTETSAYKAFQLAFFDPTRRLYRDGVGTDHSSLHASLFPLAFGLVPRLDRGAVATALASRGMVGSVYAAQFLLQGLFENGQADAALRLITADGDRSWKHMVDSGATITWEAWDQRYKPNQDWNHAWGAAPANLLPRYVLGVQTLAPGWALASIRPHLGKLSRAGGRVPTPKGEIVIEWRHNRGYSLKLELPRGISSYVELPATPGATGVLRAGGRIAAQRDGAYWKIDRPLVGTLKVEETFVSDASVSHSFSGK